jgi:membrane-associated HD superfamily phosphohydrolase
MQALADTISRSHLERREFLSQMRRDTQRMLEKASRARRAVARETVHEASVLSDSLKATNRENQQSVARSLRSIRYQRSAKSAQQRISLNQSVAKNRRSVQRELEENRSQRMQMSRQWSREVAKSIRTIRTQVQQIKSTSRLLQSRNANDLSATRRIWGRVSSAK